MLIIIARLLKLLIEGQPTVRRGAVMDISIYDLLCINRLGLKFKLLYLNLTLSGLTTITNSTITHHITITTTCGVGKLKREEVKSVVMKDQQVKSLCRNEEIVGEATTRLYVFFTFKIMMSTQSECSENCVFRSYVEALAL
eukprot:TRINITY_DN3254_c0_g2_i5.p1 TRINITY_DN3254_c0_g2~~TRINITY_DN3254_c0_g2_i5.p1  ORF type:complete len:141 (-),score=23.65 TRINITY_DN3254_c0_g2_i5:373-795(-)